MNLHGMQTYAIESKKTDPHATVDNQLISTEYDLTFDVKTQWPNETSNSNFQRICQIVKGPGVKAPHT